jgi:transcriptional regulator with XRE-family HTH domain
MTTGQLINRARVAAGKSVPRAAKDCGVSERAWYQIEADENSPTISTLQKMAKGLPCLLTDLVLDLETAA